MKKIFLLVLSVAFVISCTKDDSLESTDQNLTEDQNLTDIEQYADTFEQYNLFRVDGEIVTDKNQIADLLSNSQIAHYIPEAREVNFYTSDARYNDLTDLSLERETTSDNVSYADSISHGFDEYGSSEDIDLSNAQNRTHSLLGVSGLGSLFSQTYFKDYSKKIHFVIKYSSDQSRVFVQFNNNTDLTTNSIKSGKINGSTTNASTVYMNMSIVSGNVYTNFQELLIKNDSPNKRRVYLYENTNYGGKSVIYDLNKDQYLNFSNGTFGGFASNRIRSFRSVNI